MDAGINISDLLNIEETMKSVVGSSSRFKDRVDNKIRYNCKGNAEPVEKELEDLLNCKLLRHNVKVSIIHDSDGFSRVSIETKPIYK